jgi:hypothetical protein
VRGHRPLLVVQYHDAQGIVEQFQVCDPGRRCGIQVEGAALQHGTWTRWGSLLNGFNQCLGYLSFPPSLDCS